MLRRILLGAAVLVVLLVPALWIAVRVIQGPEIPQGETDLRFEEVPVDWTHQADLEASLPFFALAAIDVDGDEVAELFAGRW